MTYCIAIDSKISVTKCPLEKGECYWQHVKTRRCCYTEQELTSSEFSQLTGRSEVSDCEVAEFRSQLYTAVTK